MTTPTTPPISSPGPGNTLAEYYAYYYKAVFNKLNKKDQDDLLINLAKPNLIIRGEPVKYENVKTFVKAVIILAEENWDKAQKKTPPPAEVPKPQQVTAEK